MNSFGSSYTFKIMIWRAKQFYKQVLRLDDRLHLKIINYLIVCSIFKSNFYRDLFILNIHNDASIDIFTYTDTCDVGVYSYIISFIFILFNYQIHMDIKKILFNYQMLEIPGTVSNGAWCLLKLSFGLS